MAASDGFVWPPRDAGGAAPPPAAAPAGRDGARETVFEQIERVWLGVERRAFARRAALSGWTPDGPGEACWRCGTGAGPFEVDGDGCAWCRGKRLGWDRFLRVGAYEGELREAILELKFERFRRTGTDLGRLIGGVIRGELDRHGVVPGRCVLVPVPTSWRNRMARGLDHTLTIARGASAASGVPVRRVLRRRHGPTQTSVPASQRRANVRGRIVARRGAGLELGEGGVAILLDDIRTTGATLGAASAALRGVLAGGEGGADGERVWAAAVAVTAEANRR